MRRILYFVLAAVMSISLAACSGKENPENTAAVTKGEPLTADKLITAEDVRELVLYEPTATAENTHSKSTVRYDSNPIGQDPVIAELYSANAQKSVAAVYEDFKARKDKRPKAVDVADFGIDAYIAYPSINLYRDGYMVVITAGSGADDAQAELLKKAAGIAAAHLDEYLKVNPTDSNLLEEQK